MFLGAEDRREHVLLFGFAEPFEGLDVHLLAGEDVEEVVGEVRGEVFLLFETARGAAEEGFEVCEVGRGEAYVGVWGGACC